MISCLFDNSHSDGCEVILYGTLSCVFLMISDADHLFTDQSHQYVFFGKAGGMLDALPIFNRNVWSVVTELRILDISSSSKI